MPTVKAYAPAAAAPLAPWTFERREPGERDVVMDVLLCGVCLSDIHQVRDEWGHATFPMVPGHEIVGRVTRVGARVTAFKPGDLAGVGCLVDSCRTCEPCRRDLQQYCQKGVPSRCADRRSRRYARAMIPALRTAAVLGLCLAATTARAEIVTKTVEYRQGDTVLEGYLAYDTAGPAKKPGVVIFHQWTGLTGYERMRAEKLAALGYVAFAGDIYGKGVRPANAKAAGAEAGKYRADRPLLRARTQAALAVLRQQPNVLPQKLVAIGYCFGGGAALELARSGADVVGVVTFHGSLDTPTPQDAKNIKGKVLVLHGADDPNVPRAAVLALEDELTGGGVNWQVVLYSGVVHSFTQPEAGSDKSTGAAYDAQADRRSWQALRDFLAELFG